MKMIMYFTEMDSSLRMLHLTEVDRMFKLMKMIKYIACWSRDDSV